MQKDLFRRSLLKKGLAFGILVLFIGTIFSPTTAMILDKNISLQFDEQTIENENKRFIKNNIMIHENYRFYDSYSSIYDWSHSISCTITKKPTKNLNADDIYFTSPLNNDIFRAGDTIEIIGTIAGNKFKNYAMEYGEGTNPTDWHTTGITLIDDGNSPIVDDTVAVWNTSHITEPGFYTLRITTNFKNKVKTLLPERTKVVIFPFLQKLINTIFQKIMTPMPRDNQKINYINDIYLDPSLKEGWPQRLDHYCDEEGDHWWGGLTEPVACDVDNDGMMEIFVHMAWDPHRIYAFKPDGSALEGWPVEITDDLGSHPGTEAPSFYDIDNDGYKEICVCGKDGLYIFNHDGSLFKFIFLRYSPIPKTETVFADLDNDGYAEIIKKYSFSGAEPPGFYLAVMDSNGTMMPGWPQNFYNMSEGGGGYIYCGSGGSVPAVGNFDDDPDLEIVAADCRNVLDEGSGEKHREGRVHVFDIDGSILPGFPVNIDGVIFSSPAVGDINKDGYDEIVFGSAYNFFPDFGLYVLDRFGNNCTGWPKLVGLDVSTGPALADFNNDGYLEIVANYIFKPYNFYVYDYLGNALPGWPQQTSWSSYRSPVVGDVNGDGNLDVLTTAGNGVDWDRYGGVYAWNIDGTLIDGFPKATEMDTQAGATIADIDNDGMVELIASSNFDWDYTIDWLKYRSSIYVWELNSEYDEVTMEWPMFHRDQQHTGYYALDFPILMKNYLK